MTIATESLALKTEQRLSDPFAAALELIQAGNLTVEELRQLQDALNQARAAKQPVLAEGETSAAQLRLTYYLSVDASSFTAAQDELYTAVKASDRTVGHQEQVQPQFATAFRQWLAEQLTEDRATALTFLRQLGAITTDGVAYEQIGVYDRLEMAKRKGTTFDLPDQFLSYMQDNKVCIGQLVFAFLRTPGGAQFQSLPGLIENLSVIASRTEQIGRNFAHDTFREQMVSTAET